MIELDPALKGSLQQLVEAFTNLEVARSEFDVATVKLNAMKLSLGDLLDMRRFQRVVFGDLLVQKLPNAGVSVIRLDAIG